MPVQLPQLLLFRSAGALLYIFILSLFEMEKVVAEERLWLKTFHKEKLLLFCFFFLPDFGRLSVTMVMAILQQFVDRKSGKKQNKWKAGKLVRSNKTKYRDLCDLRT